jgi:hypothetical protein
MTTPRSRPVNRITTARALLDTAADLPATLDAGYQAFESILAVVRHHEERSGHAFPAFVLSASAAADGRDWVVGAPSLPPATSPSAAGGDLLDEHDWADVATEVAGLAQVLVVRLRASAGHATDPRDGAACQQGAFHAARIGALLGGTGRT